MHRAESHRLVVMLSWQSRNPFAEGVGAVYRVKFRQLLPSRVDLHIQTVFHCQVTFRNPFACLLKECKNDAALDESGAIPSLLLIPSQRRSPEYKSQ